MALLFAGEHGARHAGLAHDGLQPPPAFCVYWLPLSDPALEGLVVAQGTLLDRISAQLHSDE